MDKKLVIKTNLVRKEPKFEPKNCIVEKTIELDDSSFRELTSNALRDNVYIKNNRDLMFEDADGYHCLLFVNKESGDGFLVESEGSDYARYAQYVPHAKDMLLAQELTETEIKYHNYFREHISGAINNGEKTAKINIVDLTSDSELSMMFGDCIDELIKQNPAVESIESDGEDIIINKKELITEKLYCPLKVQMYDKEDDYYYDPEDVSACALLGYEYEINEYIQNSFGSSDPDNHEKERGLMEYTWFPRLDALVYSAFPKVEQHDGVMYGVLEYQSYGKLSESDLADLIGETKGQFSDGWGEGFEQDEIELGGRVFYISFWGAKDYFLKPESEVFPQQNMTMKM